MQDSFKDEEQYREVVDYLLGELKDEDAEQFEQRYLSDQDTFEYLESVEEDLIEDFLSSRLGAHDRLLFEQRYLPRPENREKIDFAKKLLACILPEPESEDSRLESSGPQRDQPNKTDQAQEGTPSEVQKKTNGHEPVSVNTKLDFGASRPSIPARKSWIYSRGFAAAAAVALLVLVVYLTVDVRRLHNRLASIEQTKARLEQTERELQNRLEAEQGNNKQLSEELERIKDQLKTLEPKGTGGAGGIGSTIVSLFLPLNGTRSSSHSHPVRLPPGTATLDLKLGLTRLDLVACQATVRQLTGGVVESARNLKPSRTSSGAVVEVKVPAIGLKPGDYIVTLDGTTASGEPAFAGECSFTVIRQ
ncbi:MAG TPA: hypothetical protein VJX67_05465 [Blastocatellia bacterium]|nr:hypothetical protein [Blastocatellia bacterium]